LHGHCSTAQSGLCLYVVDVAFAEAQHLSQAAIAATLDIAAPVQQVQWNSLGNWLAVTDTTCVQLWRASFGAAGAWTMLSRVATRPADGTIDGVDDDSIGMGD
jgi:hypothetical protein